MAVLERKWPSGKSVNGADATFGREHNGILMTPQEFDGADFADEYRFELINGMLIVTPVPLNAEIDPNQYLGYLLIQYQESHPKGAALNRTLPEQIIRCGANRRRAGRVIWAGLKHRTHKYQTPTIVVEFVSMRKRDRERGYESKRQEYGALGVKEYWIFDRFERSLTVFGRQSGRAKPQVIRENQIYRTPLLPGFELPVNALLARADDWTDEESESSVESE